MSKNLFIAGTGTDVGKTFVTGLIMKKLSEVSRNISYFKAAMSGNLRDKKGSLIPGDAVSVKNISGILQTTDEMCPYVYENAVSPHLASQIEGNAVEMNNVKKFFYDLSCKYDYMTVEGSGGIICPLRFDSQKIMLEDVVKELSLSCILVADAGLGTINSVVLTVEYMRSKEIPVKGIIFNRVCKGNLMHEDNIKMCKYITGLDVIDCVEDGCDSLNIDAYKLAEYYE